MHLPNIHFMYTPNGHYVAMSFIEAATKPKRTIQIESRHFKPQSRPCPVNHWEDIKWSCMLADQLISEALKCKK